MHLTQPEKDDIKRALVVSLRDESEITKIVVFGSFLTASDPHDLDVAVFQNSNQTYLPLAMKYRRKTRMLAKRITLDILPLKAGVQDSVMLNAIAHGEVIYEK
ncbi:MAG: nucleotidyltransferase domain-containing protein [Desulfuromusa sp.]|nr:nucleotidyltransferase domain-containing protein [Desulfuromusa sp.]